MKAAWIALAMLALSAPAAAQEARQVRRGQPVAADPNLAYLLFREDPQQRSDGYDYVLARELPGTVSRERDAAPPRFDPQAPLIRTDSRYPYVDDAGPRTYLIAVPPGTYTIVAITFKRMPAIGTCLCMGTVRFDARAGALNDLGYLIGALEDYPTNVPELARYTGSPHWTHTAPALAIMAVRPPTEAMAVPATLNSLPLVRAEYRAVAKFPNYFRTMINRVPAIPGILAYEGDRAIDLRSAGN